MDFNSATISYFGERTSKKKNAVSENQKTPKLPKIVLRNAAGFILKTETTYQNAIYEAKSNLSLPHHRLTDTEWR